MNKITKWIVSRLKIHAGKIEWKAFCPFFSNIQVSLWKHVTHNAFNSFWKWNKIIPFACLFVLLSSVHYLHDCNGHLSFKTCIPFECFQLLWMWCFLLIPPTSNFIHLSLYFTWYVERNKCLNDTASFVFTPSHFPLLYRL